jgi:hypothetical protein
LPSPPPQEKRTKEKIKQKQKTQTQPIIPEFSQNFTIYPEISPYFCNPPSYKNSQKTHES